MHHRAMAQKEVHFALLNAPYAILAVILFVIEVLIALFVTDGFVRGYLGDVLAVVLVYAAPRAVTRMGVAGALAVTLGIALAIETAQALGVLRMLGLADNRVVAIVFGGVFDLLDIAAYLAGGALVVVAIPMAFAEERMLKRVNAEGEAVVKADGRFDVIAPDAQTQDAFGPNLMDGSRRVQVVEQGMRQGRAIAARVKAFWS